MKSVRTRILIIAMLLIPGISNAQIHNNKNTKNKEFKMSVTERNKETVRNLYEVSLNKGDLSLLHNFIADDYVGPLGEKGVSGFEGNIAPLIQAFPGIYWKVEDLFGEGDKVVARWKWQGTQTGPYRNIAATGKTITNEGMAIYTLREGKITGAQVQTDRLGFLQAMDIVPTDPSSLLLKKANKDAVYFIDKFLVPANAIKEFSERVQINRSFIKTLPGFIQDAEYQYTDHDGNLICVTVAQWESKDAINKAKDAVQTEYQKQGFDMAAMIKRLNITIDRGFYTKSND